MNAHHPVFGKQVYSHTGCDMSDIAEEKYKSLLIVNESSDAWVTLYLYPTWDFICWLSFESKIIKPKGGKFLHRSSKGFKFELVARFRDGRRSKQTLQEPEEWDEDKLLKITDSLDLIEGKLEDFPEEKRVCLRKAQRDKELNTNGKRNLYEILGLELNQVRKMPKEDQIKAIKKGYLKEIQRWHPDKNFGDVENAKEIILAYEILKDEEKRARYHNEADYDNGWLSLKRWKAIFRPERVTEEQKKAYKHRMIMLAVSLGIMIGGTALTVGTAGLAAPAVVATGTVLGGGFIGAGRQSLQHTANRKSVVDEWDTKQWLIKAGIGFVGGAATGGAAAGITAGVVGLGAAATESAALTMGQLVGIGAGSGAVGGVARSLASHAWKEIKVDKRVKKERCQQLMTPLIDDDTGVEGPRVDGENDQITRKRVRAELSEENNEHRINWRSHSKYSCSCQPLVQEEALSDDQVATLSTIFEDVEDGVHDQSEAEDCKVKYISEGGWFSKMVVSYSLRGKRITQEVRGSGKSVTIPGNATQLEVKFQVRRPFWGDLKKYDRFKRCWCKPDQPHVFKFNTPPPLRTFTISGGLWWEAVMRISDEYHDETKEM